MQVLLWTKATMLNTEPGLPRLLSAETQRNKTQKLLVWKREIKKTLDLLWKYATGHRLVWGIGFTLLFEDTDFDYFSHRLETKIFVSGHSELKNVWTFRISKLLVWNKYPS